VIVTITTLRDGKRYLIQVCIDGEVRESYEAEQWTVERKRVDLIDRWCNETGVLEVEATRIPWPIELKRGDSI